MREWTFGLGSNLQGHSGQKSVLHVFYLSETFIIHLDLFIIWIIYFIDIQLQFHGRWEISAGVAKS